MSLLSFETNEKRGHRRTCIHQNYKKLCITPTLLTTPTNIATQFIFTLYLCCRFFHVHAESWIYILYVYQSVQRWNFANATDEIGKARTSNAANREKRTNSVCLLITLFQWIFICETFTRFMIDSVRCFHFFVFDFCCMRRWRCILCYVLFEDTQHTLHTHIFYYNFAMPFTHSLELSWW